MITQNLNLLAGVNKPPALKSKILISFFSLIIMIFRQPELLYQPRFFAEEGTNYFSFAHNNSLFDTLVTAQYGYYTLYNSFATALATLSSLENAPLVTVYLALSVQMLTIGMVIWGDRPIFDATWKRLVIALTIPVVSYAEIWLNTIGMQYWFCVITFLLLLEDPTSDGWRIRLPKNALLFLCGMTGVVSCFMTPVFLLKAIETRSKKFITYTAILALGSLLQVSAFFRALHAHDPGLQMRLVANNPVSLLTKTVIYQFAIPFSGRGVYELPFLQDISEAINSLIIRIFSSTPFISGFFALPFTVGTIILLFLLYHSVTKFRQAEIRYIAIAFVLVSGLSVLFSVNMSGGPRYTYAPSVMLVTMLVFLTGYQRRNVSTFLFAILLIACSLTANATEFRKTMYLSYNSEYPAWREEVRKWRIVGPAYPLQIWPPPWKMYLQQKTK